MPTGLTKSPNSDTSARGRLFHAGIFLKGLDGVIETIGGLALWLTGPGRIVNLVYRITQDEINKDSDDFIVKHVRHAAGHLSVSGAHFMAVYLFLHGIVKIVVVLALFRGKLWAYPVSIAVFGGFVVYQLYRFTHTHGIGLLLLSAFDLVIIWLIWLEYRDTKKKRGADAPA